MSAHDERLRNLVAEQAAEWVVAHAEGPLDPPRAREFMRWLRQSPLHVAEFLSVSGVARNVADAARVDSAALADLLREDAGVVDFQSSLASPIHARAADPSARVRPARRRIVLGLAAAVALVVMVAGALALVRHWTTPAPLVASYATLHGQERSVRLPDGTLVQLDSDSAITMRYGRTHRRVTVDRGQAYFEVAKNAARPFSVAVAHSVIRDIGTAFDVFARANGATVTVAQGRIGIWNARQGDANAVGWLPWSRATAKPAGNPVAELGAGQQVRIADSGQVTWLGPVEVARALAWRRGEIAFDNQGIGAVAAQFNRYNAIQIEVRDSAIAALPISGTFRARNVTAFVAFLRSLPGVHVDDQGQQIVVAAAARPQPRGR